MPGPRDLIMKGLVLANSLKVQSISEGKSEQQGLAAPGYVASIARNKRSMNA